MRTITEHQVNECNEKLSIEVQEEPGPGGANHLYRISGFDSSTNTSCQSTERYGAPATHSTILFQNGPIDEVGTNGITQEVLIAVLIDRLRCFQAGLYACRENALALTKLEEAQMWLHSRTRSRLSRGVEGTHKV